MDAIQYADALSTDSAIILDCLLDSVCFGLGGFIGLQLTG
jgi:hypothetical protein